MAEVITNHAAFYSITDGKICRTLKSPTSKSIERVNKMGKIVHEEFCNGLSGRIVDIKTKDHPDYGKFWLVTLKDGDWSGVIQMKFSSGYASAFLKMLPNVDLSKEVTIVPNMKIEGDKKKTSLFIMQNGKPLKHLYTKDNPNGLPQMKIIKVKGKETWDDTEMMEFLEKMVFTEVTPKLNGSSESSQSEDTAEIADLDF